MMRRSRNFLALACIAFTSMAMFALAPANATQYSIFSPQPLEFQILDERPAYIEVLFNHSALDHFEVPDAVPDLTTETLQKRTAYETNAEHRRHLVATETRIHTHSIRYHDRE